MTNPTGINGLQHRPQDVYRCSPEELKARGTHGGQTAGKRRHDTAKWRAVRAAVVACQGSPDWSALALLYDLAYRRGSSARDERDRRHVKAAQPLHGPTPLESAS